MNAILLIDANENVKEAIINLINELEESYHFFSFAEEKGEYKIRKYESLKNWIPFFGNLGHCILRFRHGGDFSHRKKDVYKNLPKANLNICYGGLGRKEDRNYFDESVCFTRLSLIKEEGKLNLSSFKKKDAKQLLDYAIGRSTIYPFCLLPLTYSSKIEKQLNEFYTENINIENRIYFLQQVLNKDSNVLVIWNKQFNGNYDDESKRKYFFSSQIISQALGIKNFGGNINFCLDKDAFEKIEHTIYHYDLLIISAELAWHNEFLSDFYGVDLVAFIRKRGYRGIIIISSPLTWEYFRELIKLYPQRFKIMMTPFHYFLKLGEEDKETPNTGTLKEQKMSPALLEDIQYYVLNRAGNLHSVFHGLKGRIRAALKRSAKNREIVKIMEVFFDRDISPLISLGKQLKLQQIKREVLEKITLALEIHPYFDIIQLVYHQILELIPQNNNELETIDSTEDWGILFVDDYKNIRSEVKNLFEKSGISCYTAASGEAAFDILKKDLDGKLPKKNDENTFHNPNFILLLIADFRLLHKGGHWQNMQGYDVIKHACEAYNNFLSYAILTDKRGPILQEVKRKSELQIAWFIKEVLSNNNSRKSFVADIKELGRASYDAFIAIPKNPAWEKGVRDSVALKVWYSYYRNCKDYEYYERKINELCLIYIKLIKLFKKRKDIETKGIEVSAELDYNITMTQDTINKFQGVFNRRYSTRLTKGPIDKPTDIGVFVNRLLGRRLVIALMGFNHLIEPFIESNPKEVLESILKKCNPISEIERPDAHLFTSYLAIPKEDWENRDKWIIEERKFLDDLRKNPK